LQLEPQEYHGKKGEATPWTVLKKPCWFDDVCCTYSYFKHDCGNHPMKKTSALASWCLQGCCHRGVAKKRPSGFGMKKALFTSESRRKNDTSSNISRIEDAAGKNET